MFSSLQFVRTKAGLQMVGRAESLYSVLRDEPVQGDGSTTAFYTEHAPLVDLNDSGTVTIADVTVFVNGTSVTISSIDATQGKITLSAAPANGADLTVIYAWSPADDSDVTIARAAGNGVVNSYLTKIYSTPVETVNTNFTGSPAEAILKEIEALISASFLLDGRQTEDNNVIDGSDLYKKGIEYLEKITERKLSLIDTTGAILAEKNSAGISSYPTQSATDDGAIGPFFTAEDKQL